MKHEDADIMSKGTDSNPDHRFMVEAFDDFERAAAKLKAGWPKAYGAAIRLHAGAALSAIAAPEPPAPEPSKRLQRKQIYDAGYAQGQADAVAAHLAGTPQAAIGAPAEDWLPGMRRAADRAPDAGGTGTPAKPLRTIQHAQGVVDRALASADDFPGHKSVSVMGMFSIRDALSLCAALANERRG